MKNPFKTNLPIPCHDVIACFIVELHKLSWPVFLQRCVVVQEVYPDGLIAMDGRLQPGDQIIEINGVDMTCAPHQQVSLNLTN